VEDVVVVMEKNSFWPFRGSLRETPSMELGAGRPKSDGELPVDDKEIDFVIMGLCLPGIGLSPQDKPRLLRNFRFDERPHPGSACCSLFPPWDWGRN